jgi:hypothetical protein
MQTFSEAYPDEEFVQLVATQMLHQQFPTLPQSL